MTPTTPTSPRTLATLVLAALPLLAVAGCEHSAGRPPVPTFGEAVRHNMALQIIDPEPEVAAGPPAYDGTRAALMITRYKTDEIDEPAGAEAATIGVVLEQGD